MPPEEKPGESIVEEFAKGVSEAPPAAPPDAGAPPSTEQGTPVSVPAPAPVEPKDKGDVPYSRFAEVNDKFRNSEKEFEEYKSGAAKREEDAGYRLLQGMAENDPVLKRALMGETQPAAPSSEPPAEPGSPEALQAQIASLQKDAQAGRDWQENQDRTTALREVESTVSAEMTKYDNLKNPQAAKMAKEMVFVRLLKDEQAAPEAVVRQVSEEVEAWKESQQAEYIAGKKAAAAAVPPGAGGQGGHVVTEAPPKLSLENRSVRDAFAAELAAGQQQT